MVLGRLFHYAIDAVLVSTVVAGVRRSSGFTYVLTFILRCQSNARCAILRSLQSSNIIDTRSHDAFGRGELSRRWGDDLRHDTGDCCKQQLLQAGIDEAVKIVIF